MSMGKPSVAAWEPLIEPQETQTKIMQILLTIIMVCIPLMLCVKPIYLISTHKDDHKDPEIEMQNVTGGGYATGDDDYQNADSFEQKKTITASEDGLQIKEDLIKSLGLEPERPHDAIEIFIHQMIETIEFVLGAISNTASYLRLWALSLAHSQLSKVFYDQIVMPAITSGSLLQMYLTFFGFIGATFGVLMVMDVMECALHTLRLHWVEFMSKFFKGAGTPFRPTKVRSSIEAAM